MRIYYFKNQLQNVSFFQKAPTKYWLSAFTGVDTMEKRISKLIHIYWADLNLAEEIQDTDMTPLNNTISI